MSARILHVNDTLSAADYRSHVARFVVMTASAPMPNKVKRPYRRVAVVELAEPGVLPKMISPRARGVARIVATWERCHVGSGGPRTAYGRALAEARALADDLNAAAPRVVAP